MVNYIFLRVSADEQQSAIFLRIVMGITAPSFSRKTFASIRENTAGGHWPRWTSFGTVEQQLLSSKIGSCGDAVLLFREHPWFYEKMKQILVCSELSLKLKLK